MHKYWVAYLMNLQQEMERRASFVMERVRSLALVISLYFLWSSILPDPSRDFLGYSRKQMLTYVLGLALLRALVLTSRSLELSWEIARGRISHQLMRPLNLFIYQFSQDLSDKTIRLLAAVLEVAALTAVFGATLYVPQNAATWPVALAAVMGALILYFLIGLALSSTGFWSAESIGFLWAASLLIEFTAGAFFPLDVLPKSVAQAFMALPFPYLIYFPINVFLERLPPQKILSGLAIQAGWIAGFYLFVKWLWTQGLKTYQAEGG